MIAPKAKNTNEKVILNSPKNRFISGKIALPSSQKRIQGEITVDIKDMDKAC